MDELYLDLWERGMWHHRVWVLYGRFFAWRETGDELTTPPGSALLGEHIISAHSCKNSKRRLGCVYYFGHS